MRKSIKIPWEDFVKIAMDNLGDKYKGLVFVGEPTFMKTYTYESDGECYEIPKYVEIEIK